MINMEMPAKKVAGKRKPLFWDNSSVPATRVTYKESARTPSLQTLFSFTNALSNRNAMRESSKKRE
jgi:hypothetical protein